MVNNGKIKHVERFYKVFRPLHFCTFLVLPLLDCLVKYLEAPHTTRSARVKSTPAKIPHMNSLTAKDFSEENKNI